MLSVLPQNTLPSHSLKDSYQTVKSAVKDHAVGAKRRNPEASAKRAKAAEDLAPPASQLDQLMEQLQDNTRAFLGGAAADCRAPTDFSGLIPKSSAAADCQPENKRQRTIRTFEDIATQRQARGALKEIPSNLDYLPPVQAAPALQSAAGACTQTAAERQLPPSACAPIDWSLKTTARFSSHVPFAIYEDALQAPGREVVEAQRCMVSYGGLAGLSLRQQVLAALLSFQHPAAPRAAPAGSRTRGPDVEALARRQDWQSAFSSLYDNYRNGQCGAFYYVAPESSSRGFVAFFGAAGVAGRPRLHAILTRSTAGMRALLRQSLGVGFAAPLLPGGGDGPAAAAGAADEAGGGSNQSALVFEGALRVHGLFDFLLNESWRLHGDDCDVPLLLSPTQFVHACLKPHVPKVLGAHESRDGSRAQHRIELRGLLPPWVLDRLTSILAVTQDGSLTLLCDTHPSTLSLNWQPGGGSSSAAPSRLDDCAARERGCVDAEEAARWQQAVPGLSCNVVRELRCEGGVFTAHLSSKSAARLG